MKYTPGELQETFQSLLRALSTTLESNHVPWMVIGGLAVGAWTEPRATRDCGIALALPDPPDLLIEALRNAGFNDGLERLAAAREGGPVRTAFGRSDGPHLAVDVLVAGTPFEAAALSRRRRLTLLGVPVFAAAPDDLIVYKLVAGRPQDAADVDRLLRAGIAPEDDATVRHWAREWDVEPAWDRAIEASRRDGVGED